MPDEPRAIDDPEVAEERALIAAAQGRGAAGSPSPRDAWGLLFEANRDQIYATCLRMVTDPEAAADLTQDVFLKAIGSLERFDAKARLATWLTRIAMNACVSHLRASKLRRHASFEGLEEAAGPLGATSRLTSGEPRATSELEGVSGVEVRDASGVERRSVLAALDRLSPEHRSVLVLRDVRGLEYEQIGLVLEMPVGTVRSRLFRARRALEQAVRAVMASGDDGDGAGEGPRPGKG